MISSLEKLLNTPRDNALLRYSLGIEHAKLGEHARAIEYLREAVTRDPQYSAAWKALGNALRDSGQVAEALQAYRSGRTCHPLLPFADWDGCRPAIGRLGNVIIAGCRDHGAARQLGFVPTHGLGAALTMVRGWSDRPPRIAFLLSPPYFPLRVTS